MHFLVTNLKSDFFFRVEFVKVIRHFDGCKADLVVCDGAPDGITVNSFRFLLFG